MAKRPVSPATGLTRRQASRARREAQMQRLVLAGSVVTAIAVIGVLVYAYVNQQYLLPNHAVATVNGEAITVKQFQDRVKVDLYFLALNPFAGSTDPRVIAQQSLDNLIDEALMRQEAKELNVTVIDSEVQHRAELAFGYNGGRLLPTATPFPTEEPTKPTTPTLTSTFVFTPTPTQTETPNPSLTTTPTETSASLPTVTPTLDLTTTATPTTAPTATTIPTATLTLTPYPTSTPVALDQYTKQSTDFFTNAAKATGLTAEQFKSIWYDKVRALILREKLIPALKIDPDQTREMVHAAHILVDSQDAAKQVLDRIAKGESFEKLAAELSRDTSNAYRGGDLGWFNHEDMVAPFADVAFSTQPGTISQPVQTQYGWHIIKVYEKAAVPLTPSEKDSNIQTKFDDMVKKWRGEGKVITEDNWIQHVPQLNASQGSGGTP